MKILKCILISLLFIIVLVSCGNKKDKEINYTLSQEIVIDKDTNYSKEVVIPSHQYVHFSFEKNNTYFVYGIKVCKVIDYLGERKQIIDFADTLFHSDVFCDDNDNEFIHEYNYKYLKGDRLFLDNGSHFINIYNASSKECVYVFSMYTTFNDYYDKTFDIRSIHIKGANEYNGTIRLSDVINCKISSVNYDFERYDFARSGACMLLPSNE